MKYYLAFIIPVVTFFSLNADGLGTYATVMLSFGVIPALELLLKEDKGHLESSKSSTLYDFALYLMIPVQYVLIYFYVNRIAQGDLLISEQIGMTLSMGIQCGAIGINVAHELGHRSKKYERALAKMLLLTSLYMHFYIEHNRGHHKKVGTLEDPATARLNESIYAFWIRTVFGSMASAWNIEKETQKKKGSAPVSLSNQMIQFILIEVSFLILIYFFFGIGAMGGFVVASIIGWLLLETVNYIEHYGLYRKELSPGRFEKVQPKHSWNSDFPVGRILLFELTRHSDHHYKASKKYQYLEHMEDSPNLPSGYPGMMLLSLVPPLWFRIVNKRIPA